MDCITTQTETPPRFHTDSQPTMDSDARTAINALNKCSGSLVYIATTIPNYSADFYREAISWARHTFPDAVIIPADSTWESSDHWRNAWDTFSRKIDLIIVVTAHDGMIGPGVYKELWPYPTAKRRTLWYRAAKTVSGKPSVRYWFSTRVIDDESRTRFARISVTRGNSHGS